MKALYYTGVGEMELRDIPKPIPSSNEYLIKVKSVGICGSDFEGYLGKTGRRIPPVIMGHELSGVVEEAPQGGKYPIGTTCVIFPKPFCGKCDYCKAGLVNLCPNGICIGCMDKDGAMCEYIISEEKYLIPFSNVDYDLASLAEPLAVAYRATQKIDDKDLKAANFISVIGAGTIGLFTAAILKHKGCRNVIVCDTKEFRLEKAREMGATAVINSATENYRERINELTDSRKCDYSFEAVGIGPTVTSCLESLKIGGIAVWIGNAQKTISINMQDIVTHEIKIFGNYVYDYEGFIHCVHLIEDGKIDVGKLITGVYDLSDGVKAFKDLEDNKDGKKIKSILHC